MNLKILSLKKALQHTPLDKNYLIGIINSHYEVSEPILIKSDQWINTKNYHFDDLWPDQWKEYSWADLNDPYFSGLLTKKWGGTKKLYPKITKTGLLDYFESQGKIWRGNVV